MISTRLVRINSSSYFLLRGAGGGTSSSGWSTSMNSFILQIKYKQKQSGSFKQYPFMVLRNTLLFTLLLILLHSAAAEDKLLMIQGLIRHGARTLYRANQNNQTAQQEEVNTKAQLTPQGKHMSYVLGKLLYQKYWKLLFQGTEYEHKFYSSLLEVWSTPTDRTIETAQALLFGLLEDLQPQVLQKVQYKYSVPPFNDTDIKTISSSDNFGVFGLKGLHYHTVPIHTQPVMESKSFEEVFKNRIHKIGNNFLTIHDSDHCPNQKKWRKENLERKEYKKIFNSKEVKQFCQEVSKQLGYRIEKPQEIYRIVDEYHVLKHLGRPTLKIFQNPKNIKTAEFLRSSIILLFSHRLHQRRTVFTPFLQTINQQIHKTIKHGKPNIVLYVAHETTLLNFLAAFKMTSLKCLTDQFYDQKQNDACATQYPQFSSSVIIQLWKQESGLHYLKILYNGVEKKIPVCENQVKCSLQKLQGWAQNFYQKDSWKACGLPQIKIK